MLNGHNCFVANYVYLWEKKTGVLSGVTTCAILRLITSFVAGITVNMWIAEDYVSHSRLAES